VELLVIRRAIRADATTVRACYQAQLAARPELEGRIEVQITLAASGVATDARIATSTLNDDALRECALAAARGWRLGPLTSRATISFSWVLDRPRRR
jgi:TonB family protein